MTGRVGTKLDAVAGMDTSRITAVIDIGTASIRMALAEIDDRGRIRPLENLSQSVQLGRDSFTRGRIRTRTLEECVRILRSFREIMAEYRVKPENIRAVATSSVQEASNRQHVVDRIYMATGINVEIIEGAEATRLTYLSILPSLRKRKKKNTKAVVVEVGGGQTELLALEGETIVETRVARLGSVRLRNLLDRQRTGLWEVRNVLDQELSHTVRQLIEQFPTNPDVLVVLGGEARFVAEQLNPDWDRHHLQNVALRDWKALAESLLEMSPEELVQEYRMTFEEAEPLACAVYAQLKLAEALGVTSLHVSGYTMRDGLLEQMAQRGGWSKKYVRQMIDSAKALGTKYQIDPKHAAEVAGLALQLFDALESEHRLEPRDRVLLEIAAQVHEVGGFVSANSHHKHSLYLLLHNDIFGLGSRNKRIVANVARYHRRSAPKPSHTQYASLSRDDRIRVLQLSAILRVADSIARSRGKRIETIHCEEKETEFIIRVPNVDNLHLESSALQRRGGMFEDVFGMNVILVKG